MTEATLEVALQTVRDLHQENREIYAQENQRARQGYTTRPYADLCCLHPYKTSHYPLRNEVKFVDQDSHWYTVGSRKPSTQDFTLTTSTGTTELKFLKHECPQSRNITGEWYNNGLLREQFLAGTVRIKMHQSQPTIVI